MYQILCDGFVLYDPRDDELTLMNKRCKIGSNICGEASFSILANHPYYDKLKKLRSVFEIKQDGETIFRGRMTDESRDFENAKEIDLEGALAYLNDSTIRPFSFPEDFPDATSAENIVEYFFSWLIEQHNSQVQAFQRFKVGRVTVKDPNNYIARSCTDYSNSWEAVKDSLFGSSLGGYLCIRYEPDGNYLDYLADYADENGNKIINSQPIEYGVNLLDFNCESDGKETYSAVIPLGSKESGLDISSLPDGNITDDIVKDGDTLYSRKAVAEYGWICAPTDETRFEDVTITLNLQERGVSFLEQKSVGFTETITFSAIDLHLTDKEIEAFRVYKYVAAYSNPHGSSGVYPLSELDIDMDNLQNTKITVGETRSGLAEKTSSTNKIVQAMRGDYATKAEILLTKREITLTVESLEKGLGQTLRVAADGVTITNASGDTLTIDGGQIDASKIKTADLELTGAIAWGDLASGVQSKISSANDAASSAKTIASSIANGTYSGGTFINGKSIYSPTIYSNDFSVLPETNGGVSGFNLYGYFGSALYHFLKIGYFEGDSPNVLFQSPAGGFASWSFAATRFYGKLDFNGATVTGLTTTAVFA